ncbi:MAG: Rab family GTPase [Candidatus Ranarchaeia archaeon]
MITGLNYDFVFKVVLLGEGGVGKTSLILKYTQNKFEENYKPTLGTDFAVHIVEYNNQKVCFQIWDLGGQEHFEQLRAIYCKGAAGAILVFDVTRPDTYLVMKNWYDKLKKNGTTEYLTRQEVLLIGNKVDLPDERLVPIEAGKMFEKWLKIKYIETSAKTGLNVDKLFLKLAKSLVDKINK